MHWYFSIEAISHKYNDITIVSTYNCRNKLKLLETNHESEEILFHSFVDFSAAVMIF